MGVALFALIFAGAGLMYNHLESFKFNLSRNLSVLAGTIGFNSRAALYFDDKKTGLNTLSSVVEERQVQFAAIYDIDGKIFVQYSRNPEDPFRRALLAESGIHFFDEGLEVVKPISLKGKTIGSIYLFSDLEEYHNTFREALIFFGIILGLTLALCLALSFRIQSIISKPILKLAGTAGEISQHSNYSIRVDHAKDDEIGKLYAGFNVMLEAVQNRENELINYKDNLEEIIEQRTRELKMEIRLREQIEEKIKRSLKDKEVLLREINHRAKNNMQIISSLLWLQAQKISVKEYADKFQECALRLQTMSMIHENLYDSEHLHDIDLNTLLSKLINNLETSYGLGQRIQFNIKVEPIKLDIEKNMYCGLIAHELISNALLHGFPNGTKGNIDISAYFVDENVVKLSISDNGIGLNDNFNLDQVNTVGLQLVVSLAQDKLKGKLHLSRTLGTEFSITFPMD
jgi:two-component sensor histidine kinase